MKYKLKSYKLINPHISLQKHPQAYLSPYETKVAKNMELIMKHKPKTYKPINKLKQTPLNMGLLSI